MIISFCGHSQLANHAFVKEQLDSFLCTLPLDQPIRFYLGGYGDFDNISYACCKRFASAHPTVGAGIAHPSLPSFLSKSP